MAKVLGTLPIEPLCVNAVRLTGAARRFSARNRHVYFTRHELNLMLSLYSRRVINGEWKDYAIDHGKRLSAFSVFRDSCDRPIFTVFKYGSVCVQLLTKTAFT